MALIDTLGWEERLVMHKWHPHPQIDDLWQRDGGEWKTTAQAISIEMTEQQGRDRIKAQRAADSAEERREVEERRRRMIEQQGSGRVERIRIK